MPSSRDLPKPGLPHRRWILYQLSHQENPALLEQDISPIANLLIRSSLHKAGSQALITRQPVFFPKQSSPLIFQGKATPGLIFTTDGQRLRFPEIKMISHLRPAVEDSLVPWVPALIASPHVEELSVLIRSLQRNRLGIFMLLFTFSLQSSQRKLQAQVVPVEGNPGIHKNRTQIS